ncbi:MAG: hypothetical protein C4524_03320 [Candidatus Zixiibacteriota bacterium]|nr:MAG: hypothetical protein C4524_03320 [candidate division Zixibacteria bacterium]
MGAFWLAIFLAGGYLVQVHLKARQEKLEARNKELQDDLRMKQNLIASYTTVESQLGAMQTVWAYRSKAIPRREAAHETYEYLDKILSRHSTSLNFDFLVLAVRDTGGVRSADYKLEGEARFPDFYRFIWYLEHLPRYLRINSMQLQDTEAKKDGSRGEHWVRFDLNLTAISADRPGFDQIHYTANVTAPADNYDPFRQPAKAVVSVPANTLGLPNVFETRLQAMTPTQAYVIDQNGELKVLNLGDAVYLGYLMDIFPDENRVVFYLNKLVPPRQVSLRIGGDK